MSSRMRGYLTVADKVRQSQWALWFTRLAVLKSPCQEPDVANRFITFQAQKTLGSFIEAVAGFCKLASWNRSGEKAVRPTTTAGDSFPTSCHPFTVRRRMERLARLLFA
jgi:hypothetical protein